MRRRGLLVLFFFAAVPLATGGARAGTAPRPAALELIVLGSGGPRALGRGATSYVVLLDGQPRILVDAGPGAFVELGKLGIDLEHLDLVLLTHLHVDHTGDLPAVLLARALTTPEARGSAAWPGLAGPADRRT